MTMTNNVSRPCFLACTRIVTIFLFFCGPNGAVFVGASAGNGDAGAKIQQAAAHIAEAHELLDQMMQNEGTTVAVGIDPDGSVARGAGRLQKKFRALEREIEALNEARRRTARELDTEYDHEDELLNDSLRDALDHLDDDDYKRAVFFALVESRQKSEMDPDSWRSFTYWGLHTYFSCSRTHGSRPPIYDSEKWADLRQFYHDFVERDEDDRGHVPEGRPKRTYQVSKEPFDMPLEPFQSRERGRGLKAARDIREGEIVFKATNNTIIFTDGHAWREFLFDIYERNGEPYDSGTACDVLIWSWVQELGDDGSYAIFTDLDNTSLLNEGRDEDDWDRPNVRCGKEGDEECQQTYYATKDIKEGDELLGDYRNFASKSAWEKMGL